MLDCVSFKTVARSNEANQIATPLNASAPPFQPTILTTNSCTTTNLQNFLHLCMSMYSVLMENGINV